jgi:hypothetical protein
MSVQNNNNGVLSIEFWLPDAHCAHGKKTDSSAKESTELKEGINSTEFTVIYQRF